jgi:DNA polymerase III alpha subunit
LQRVSIDAADVELLILAGCFDRLESQRTRPELMWHLKWHQAQNSTAIHRRCLFFAGERIPPSRLPQVGNYDQRLLWQQEIETLWIFWRLFIRWNSINSNCKRSRPYAPVILIAMSANAWLP